MENETANTYNYKCRMCNYEEKAMPENYVIFHSESTDTDAKINVKNICGDPTIPRKTIPCRNDKKKCDNQSILYYRDKGTHKIHYICCECEFAWE